MAETVYFQGQNKARLGIIHLWGNVKLYTFLVHGNRNIDLLMNYAMQTVNRR